MTVNLHVSTKGRESIELEIAWPISIGEKVEQKGFVIERVLAYPGSDATLLVYEDGVIISIVSVCFKKEAYDTILKMLEANGFTKTKSGGAYRPSTGCSFPYESLIKYKTVVDFQLDWPYAFPS